MKKILFVCTGNVCRSPMAEALFRRQVAGRGDYDVGSAGLSAPVGQPASGHTRDLLEELGIDVSTHASRPLTPELVDEATHIVAMTEAHRRAIEACFPEAAARTYLACEFCRDDHLRGGDIPDPIGLGRSAYEATRDALEQALPPLLEYIEQTTRNAPRTESMTDIAATMEPTAAPNPRDTAPIDSTATPARIALGADHGGFALKEQIATFLRERGHPVEDLGTHDGDSVDYPDYAHAVAERILSGRAELGILFCTSGIGMSIAANRHPGIQASVVTDPEEAAVTREHNHSNVLCLSGARTDAATAERIVEAWLDTPWADGRHARRVAKFEHAEIRAVDPEVAAAIAAEEVRQLDHVELIASENFASRAVRAAQGSVLTNKYAEGYPGRRWYGGCENVDVVEQLAIDRAKAIFGAEHANVQPHSGSQANAAVYFAFLEPGDRILTMDLAHGGHLTHGHQANFSGRFYEVTHYGVDRESERIDYDHLEELAREVRPRMITAGASAYPRVIDFERMAAIARSVDAYLFVDMAHIAGLVAGGVHPSPIPHADFVTTTTHKSLRGPRGGLILCRGEFAKKIDSMVFPGVQGGPLMHVIAAKAVCFQEALQPGFADYQRQIVANAEALAGELAAHGFRIVSGGTDNHVMLVDLRPRGLNGKIAQEALDRAGITVNKNAIPFDTESPFKGGGIRVGTPAVTTRGMREPEMRRIAGWIHRVLEAPEDDARQAEVRAEVVALNRRHPLP